MFFKNCLAICQVFFISPFFLSKEFAKILILTMLKIQKFEYIMHEIT